MSTASINLIMPDGNRFHFSEPVCPRVTTFIPGCSGGLINLNITALAGAVMTGLWALIPAPQSLPVVPAQAFSLSVLLTRVSPHPELVSSRREERFSCTYRPI